MSIEAWSSRRIPRRSVMAPMTTRPTVDASPMTATRFAASSGAIPPSACAYATRNVYGIQIEPA
eukprot:1222917-Rhodomonas_salina.1